VPLSRKVGAKATGPENGRKRQAGQKTGQVHLRRSGHRPSRTAAAARRGLQAQTGDGPACPGCGAERATTADRCTDPGQFFPCFGGVHARHPVTRLIHRPVAEPLPQFGILPRLPLEALTSADPPPVPAVRLSAAGGAVKARFRSVPWPWLFEEPGPRPSMRVPRVRLTVAPGVPWPWRARWPPIHTNSTTYVECLNRVAHGFSRGRRESYADDHS
jgi:hypothetical protein